MSTGSIFPIETIALYDVSLLSLFINKFVFRSNLFAFIYYIKFNLRTHIYLRRLTGNNKTNRIETAF